MTLPDGAAFFTRELRASRTWFKPTRHCRGPWDPEACHAGPPTGLLARALELAVPVQRLVRLTVELIRPIPHAGFFVDARVLHQGRSVSLSEAVLSTLEGRQIVTARGMHMRPSASRSFPNPPVPRHDIRMASSGGFPIDRSLHGLPAFNGDGVEVRYPPGETREPGPTRLWMRTVPLLADETPTPFQRICPLADCGNAIGRNAEPQAFSFPNTDLTVLLHREPEGEWLGSESIARWEEDGIGMADALLFDARGPVGRAIQTLLVRATPDT